MSSSSLQNRTCLQTSLSTTIDLRNEERTASAQVANHLSANDNITSISLPTAIRQSCEITTCVGAKFRGKKFVHALMEHIVS